MQTVIERTRERQKTRRGKTYEPNGKPHPMRWTVDEYYKIYEAGLFRGKRVELIRGEIIEMSPMLSPHATSIGLVSEVLRGIFTEGYDVRPQMPISLGRSDEPEPDVAVVVGSIRDYSEAHPTSAVLVVEVSLTSLRFDRTTKLRLYAESGIEDYWILNLKQRQLEVHRNPQGNGVEGFTYGEKLVFGEDQSVAPLAKPDTSIKVADMLP